MSRLFQVPLIEGEPLPSMVSRFARANGAPSTRRLCSDTGLDFHAMLRGDAAAVVHISELTGHSFEELSRIAIVSDRGGLQMSGAYFPRHTTVRSKLRFCPDCLSDDDDNTALAPGARRHSRNYWMLPQVRTCPTHSRRLVEAFDPRFLRHRGDIITQLDLVRDQMEELELASFQSPVTRFEHFVAERILGNRHHGNFLDELELSVAIVACELIGIADVHGIDVGTNALTDDELATARDTGFESLSEGWTGFRSALDRVRSNKLLFNLRSGRSMYGKLYMNLSHGYDHAQFDVLRTAIKEHTLANVPVLNGADFFGAVENGDWTTVAHVEEEVGFSDKTVRRLLVRMGYLDEVRQPKGEWFLAKKLADEAIAKLRDLISQEEAGEILGFQGRTVKRMIDDGLLDFILVGSNRGHSSVSVWTRYSRSEVTSLRDRLLARGALDFPHHWVSLHEAVQKSGRRLADIIRMVLDGGIRGVGRTSDADSLETLRLDIEEILALDKSEETCEVRSTDARARLAMDASTYAFMLREGHLRCSIKEGTSGRFGRHAVVEADLDAFDQVYVSLSKLSSELGFGYKWVANKMRSRGVVPAFPPEACRGVVYHRSDVGKIEPDIQARLCLEGVARKVTREST
ncbi:hypothetical protein GUK34_15010 [Rhizobium leguminosarum]|uniref:TniQ family protein n=1 Tax=Rhizobium ruizarguesonis TaxID=2081791 RepID=UPI0013B8A104|nr:TniQ family protein [Rhizobium ruizarguesonis]NEI06132.1 hypothetical protein [Rhizobium ruizarguesonis]